LLFGLKSSSIRPTATAQGRCGKKRLRKSRDCYDTCWLRGQVKRSRIRNIDVLAFVSAQSHFPLWKTPKTLMDESWFASQFPEEDERN